jgi:hypothetical protein
VRGSKVTKRDYMAKGRTTVEAWTRTLDEVDFFPPIYPVKHIFFMKREGASEGTVFCCSNGQK